MLEVSGTCFASCDGIRRRDFLRAGILGLGGLSLADLLKVRAKAADAGREIPKRSVIFIELAGGPTQFETYDPKPEAPAEYRGPLGTIQTALRGVRFSEMMIEQAKIAKRLAVIRSVHHNSGSHQTSSHLTQTGYYLRDRQNPDNELPCIGSVVDHLSGPNAEGVPGYVAVPRIMRYGQAAFLGKGHNPFETGGDPNKAKFKVQNLDLVGNLNLERLDDRRNLLSSLDASRRVIDNRGVGDAFDSFTRDAFELVTGDRAREAFDIAQEPDNVRDRYGRHTVGQSLLLARRLIEAGVSFVSVRVGGWDDHNQLVKRMKTKAPQYDRGVAALINDIYDRGLDHDVMVIAMGEFGRTPRFNKNAGRDHWGSLMSVMMAGGGLNVGQIVGASNSRGEVPLDSPYRPEHILATAYRHLGIDTGATFTDHAGRPRYVLEQREIVRELV